MPRCSVRVRPAASEDAPALAALAESVDLSRGTSGGRPTTAEARAQIEERFVALIVGGECEILVAEDEATGVPVGFVAMREDDVGALGPTEVLHVSHLIVSPSARRRGIGRMLLTAVVRIAEERGIDHLLASASSGSREANRYLARLGFAPMVVRRIAPISVLRRSLGMAEPADRLTMRRRARVIRAARTARRGTARSLSGQA
jgi:ribosomal protein S18 acetylase RimI-like enzyme